MKNKIITSISFFNTYYEHHLKYLGFGQVRYKKNIVTNSSITTCAGYELSGISKRYTYSTLDNLYQMKKGNQHGIEIYFKL